MNTSPDSGGARMTWRDDLRRAALVIEAGRLVRDGLTPDAIEGRLRSYFAAHCHLQPEPVDRAFMAIAKDAWLAHHGIEPLIDSEGGA